MTEKNISAHNVALNILNINAKSAKCQERVRSNLKKKHDSRLLMAYTSFFANLRA